MKVGSLVRPCEQLNNAAGWFGVVVEMREALSREGFPGIYVKVSFLGDPCRLRSCINIKLATYSSVEVMTNLW